MVHFVTFSIFSVISVVQGGASLLSNRTFTSLSLISLMTSPLLVFVQALPSLVESVSNFDRIGEYITQAPFEESIALAEADLEKCANSSISLGPGPVLEMHNASFSWGRDSPSVIHEITLSIHKGSISMVIGSVGSGKSALLESALGETAMIEGSMSPFQSSTAYCPQIKPRGSSTIQSGRIS